MSSTDVLMEKIQQAIGEASTCWENLDSTGQFDSERAIRIADELADFINREVVQKLVHVLEPLATFHDPAQLRSVAHRLLQQGGENRACGETLERAIEHLFGGGGQGSAPERPTGFDSAYGSMTFPLGPRS